MERHTPVHKADLIVVGTVRDILPLPWFDGWHITATIDVKEVLWGPASRGQSLSFASLEPWGYDLRTRLSNLRPRISSETAIRSGPGIWLLRKRPDTTWEPSLPEFGWPGWYPLNTRPQVENDIRDCKATGCDRFR